MHDILGWSTLPKRIKEAEANYYSNLLNRCWNSLWETWQHLSQILNTKRVKTCAVKKIFFEGNMLTAAQDIANALNEHFCTLGNRLSRALPDKGDEYKTYINNSIQESSFLSPVEDIDIFREIRKLGNKQSTRTRSCRSQIIQIRP